MHRTDPERWPPVGSGTRLGGLAPGRNEARAHCPSLSPDGRSLPVRTRTAALAAAAGAALLAPATLSEAAEPQDESIANYPEEEGSSAKDAEGMPGRRPPRQTQRRAPRGFEAHQGRRAPQAPRGSQAPVRAADLLAKLRGCAQLSRGKYRPDDGAPANVAVCGKRGAVSWKADMDVNCDGRPSRACNRRTDPLYLPTTAFQQSNGQHLSAERLPYVVVPQASGRWNHARHGINGGAVAAVIHRGMVRYGVVGDTGPADLIGEASYAMAKSLGINPDPRKGGTGAGVSTCSSRTPRRAPSRTTGPRSRAATRWPGSSCAGTDPAGARRPALRWICRTMPSDARGFVVSGRAVPRTAADFTQSAY